MTRTIGSALIAAMMAFGLAACNTPGTTTDTMTGSSSATSTTGSSVQTPSTTAGQGSWNSGATGATGVNSASGTTSNNEPVTNSATGR
ncbi:hypothetical protein AB2N08_00240 [Massilia aurea]|uniref:hypothetical protein n=1 Tax=Massilia aurea TaxID=373040 RepID=UPI003461DB33